MLFDKPNLAILLIMLYTRYLVELLVIEKDMLTLLLSIDTLLYRMTPMLNV